MGNRLREPKLESKGLVKKLKDKGVKFELMPETDAIKFLEMNNNYFKLTSYRKNFHKNIIEGKSVYSNLDFLHLVELSRLDMRLRYLLVKMCLDIEHSLKVMLMNDIQNNDTEDGYSIIDEYLNTQTEEIKKRIVDDIKKNSNSIYYSKLLKKHNISSYTEELIDFPVWVFLEVVSFGTFISFFSYYFINQDESNKKLVHLLNKVKQVRNAAAHNACMLNNLYSNNDKINYKPNRLITRFLGNARINEEMRKSKLSNEILYQVTIVFFIHNEYVNSRSIKLNRYNEFHTLMDDSLNTANMLFLKNDLVFSSISYLHKISQYLLNSFNPIDLKTE